MFSKINGLQQHLENAKISEPASNNFINKFDDVLKTLVNVKALIS